MADGRTGRSDEGTFRLPAPRAAYRALDDASLIEAMQRGDERAIAEFIVRYQRLLADRVRQWRDSPEAVEDAMSDVLEDVAVLIVNRRIAPTRSLGAYVLKAFRVRLSLRSRSDMERRARSVDAAEERAGVGEAAVATSVSEQTMRASRGPEWDPPAATPALARLARMLEEGLSDDERRILAWLSNYVSQRDICTWLGISYAAGTQRIWRLRERLRGAARRYAKSYAPREQLELERFFRRVDDGAPRRRRTATQADVYGGSDDEA